MLVSAAAQHSGDEAYAFRSVPGTVKAPGA
jgi:hypothetical protein